MSSKTLRTGLSLVLLAMSLAGCASYSGLSTEGVSLDAKNLKAGQSLSGVTLSPAAWPKSDWWKTLGDPQLDGLIREALHDSPDMQIADARAHQAAAAASAADAERMPTLDASAGVSRSRLARDQDPTGQGGRYATLRSLGANFNYNFDLWGGQRDAWEAALGEARAAEVDRQAAQLTLSADVAQTFQVGNVTVPASSVNHINGAVFEFPIPSGLVAGQTYDIEVHNQDGQGSITTEAFFVVPPPVAETNGRKSRSRISAGMPGPLSSTVTCTVPFRCPSSSEIAPPSGVARNAFDSRLPTTCSTRSPSESMTGRAAISCR